MTNAPSQLVASFAVVFALLANDCLAGSASIAGRGPSDATIRPTIDVAAPDSWGANEVARRGGVADRIELLGDDLREGSSVWYRLAYVDGGLRLQVFEDYAVAVADAESNMVESQETGWQVASQVVEGGSDSTSAVLPAWARVRTGNDTGYSAGLMITLAYIDLLTPGALVGELRVAGTGGIGTDGVVIPAFGLGAKIAAALLTRPDVIFTTSAPTSNIEVTVIQAEHTRLVATGSSVAQWLNLVGYEQAGRIAASHDGTVAVVVVHDVRQALAYLCGRTGRASVCAAAARSATIPIGIL